MDQQKVLRIIVIGFIVAILAMIILTVAKIQGMSTEIDSYKSIAEARAKEVKYWQDKEGRSRAQALSAEATAKVILETQGKEMQDLRKQVSGLNKNLSNLKAYITTGVKTSDTVFVTVHDTLSVGNILKYSFTYTDEWTKIEGESYDSAKTFKIAYEVRDSLTFVSYYKKQGLFKPSLLMIDGISYNPHSRITGLKNISVRQPKQKRFSIGPYIGVQFNGRPSIGIGIQYSIIRL